MNPESSQPGDFESSEPIVLGDMLQGDSAQEVVENLLTPDPLYGYINDEHRKLHAEVTILNGQIRNIDDEIRRMEDEGSDNTAHLEELRQLRIRRSNLSAESMEYSQRIEALKQE